LKSDKEGSLISRIARSFRESAGEIVFGMEDGTVSIFGLVVGVAASAPDSHTVLLAGASGAIAAAVSMMAGTYLDVESENDSRTAALAERQIEFARDPMLPFREQAERLSRAGFAKEAVEAITTILRNHPATEAQLDSAFALGISPAPARNPLVQASWMFIADVIAAFTPVLPYAWFDLPTARWISIALTGVLLLALGIGRARIGRKPVVKTTLETIGIAAGAALAGWLVGSLISG